MHRSKNMARLAAGALAVAREKGLSVPKDLSIAGFDDDIVASIVSPSLTTVRQPVEEMAAAAFELLMDDDRPAGEPAARQRLHGYQLCIRESVGKLE